LTSRDLPRKNPVTLCRMTLAGREAFDTYRKNSSSSSRIPDRSRVLFPNPDKFLFHSNSGGVPDKTKMLIFTFAEMVIRKSYRWCKPIKFPLTNMGLQFYHEISVSFR